MPRVLSRALVAGLLLCASPTRAHVRLLAPTSRYGDEMKFAPCGRLGGTRTDLVTTLRPGQSVTVVFDEIIPHPGHYRIAFDLHGDDDLAPPVWDGAAWVNPTNVAVLADDIPDAAPPALTHGEVVVQLPDAECGDCTLQLVQVMTDKPPYDGVDDFYFQCADVVLSWTAPVGGPPPPPAAPPPSGGCASSEGSPPAFALLAVLAALRRRATRAPFAPAGSARVAAHSPCGPGARPLARFEPSP